MDLERTDRYAFLPGRGLPIEIAGAEGCFLIAPDGRRILDAAGGAIVCNVGHGRAEVVEAAARALRELTYAVPPFLTGQRLALSERLRESWLPPGLTRAFFTSGGSESVDAALRIARQHFVSRGEPERWKVIGRELSYHGTTLSGLAAGGHGKRRKGMEPYLYGWPKAPACYPLRCALCRGERGCTLACADAFEAVIEEAGAASVAAVILEPVVGSTAGALVPPEGYLPRVAELCQRHGILLIADEVMCGFGRTGARFAVDHWGVVPDLLVAGKGLAGGYAPIGGVYAREEVLAPIAERGDEVMFYTFGAHPMACAAADAVLAIVEREGLVERARVQGEKLRAMLARLEAHPHVAEVRGRGLLQAVELVKDRETLEPFPPELGLVNRVIGAGLAHGAFFYPGGSPPAQDVVCVGPPLVVSDDELELLVTALEKAIDVATAV